MRERGAEAFRNLLAAAPPIVDHLFESAAGDAGSDPAARGRAVEELGPVIARIESPVERGLYVERVAQAFQIADLNAVRRVLQKGARQPTSSRERNTQQAKASEAGPVVVAPVVPLDELELALVGALIENPHLLGSDGGGRFLDVVHGTEATSVLRLAGTMAMERGAIDSVLLVAAAPDAIRGWLGGRLAKAEVSPTAAEAYVKQCVSALEKRDLLQKRNELQREALQAGRAGNMERKAELEYQILDLNRRIAGVTPR
jgi:DNA primase